jgi:hypothetical protein
MNGFQTGKSKRESAKCEKMCIVNVYKIAVEKELK